MLVILYTTSVIRESSKLYFNLSTEKILQQYNVVHKRHFLAEDNSSHSKPEQPVQYRIYFQQWHNNKS